MKKLFKVLSIIVCSLFLIVGIHTSVYASTVSLEAAGSVRAGETLSIKLIVSEKGATLLTGDLKYDSSQVTLSSVKVSNSKWKESGNGNSLWIENENNDAPIDGTTTVATINFKVNQNMKEGDVINISLENICVTTPTGGGSDIEKISCSSTVARPLSVNANLASLTVTGADLTPAFKPGTTSYDIGEVEYSVKALDIKTTTEDANAKVTIKNNSLSVGSNTVSVIVTAENGTQKTYKIKVTRKQDPNYVASNNANLKALKVSQGILSPVFSADVTAYVVYLPYESVGATFTASGTEEHSKAQGVVAGTIDSLVEGKNQTVVVCKAEDGTEKTYSVIVYVMPKFEGTLPSIGGAVDTPVTPPVEPGDTEEPTENPTEVPSETEKSSEEPSQEPSEDKDDQTTDNKNDNGGLITIFVVIIVLGLVGALVYVLFFAKKKF